MERCYLCRTNEREVLVIEKWHNEHAECTKEYCACYPCVYELAKQIGETNHKKRLYDEVKVMPL